MRVNKLVKLRGLRCFERDQLHKVPPQGFIQVSRIAGEREDFGGSVFELCRMFQKLGFSELGWVDFYGMCLTKSSSRTSKYPQQTLWLTKLPVGSFIDLSLIPCLGGNRRYPSTSFREKPYSYFCLCLRLCSWCIFFFLQGYQRNKAVTASARSTKCQSL